MSTTKTILTTAYSVNPFKGSEDGMGWNAIYQIARFNKVNAITRKNNRSDIERFMEEHPDQVYENIQFYFFDLPYWMRFWKKKSRGAMLYFWMWQKAIPSFVKREKIECDIVHNLNFHNDWTPSYLYKLDKPFVWGPIGHHPLIPSQYLESYSKKYYIKDRLAWGIKNLFWKYSKDLRQSVRNARHIFCMNKSVEEVLPGLKGKSSIVPSVATGDFGCQKMNEKEKFSLISVGRLVPLKGFDLSISAFADFLNTKSDKEKNKCELIIVGSGPEKSFLQNMAQEKEVGPYIKFVDWMERDELLKLYKKVSAFLFPSHEGAGMVVAEALSFGLPVICLDNCGPGEFIDKNCGIAIEQKDYQSTVEGLSHGIDSLFTNSSLLHEMSRKARQRFEQFFNWDIRGEQFQSLYQTL